MSLLSIIMQAFWSQYIIIHVVTYFKIMENKTATIILSHKVALHLKLALRYYVYENNSNPNGADSIRSTWPLGFKVNESIFVDRLKFDINNILFHLSKQRHTQTRQIITNKIGKTTSAYSKLIFPEDWATTKKLTGFGIDTEKVGRLSQ